MKLQLLCIFVLFSLVTGVPGIVYAQDDSSSGFTFVIKGGFDLMGEGDLDIDEYDYSESGDVDSNISLGAEAYFNFDPVLFGVGAAYLLPRKLEDSDGKISLFPIYGAINYPFTPGGFTPYITGQIGYNFFFIDSKLENELDALIGDECDYTTEGGLYWALGGGIILENNIQFELLYSNSSAGLDIENSTGESVTMDLTYTKFTVSIGYRF
jgi:hypothetical protein